jgi:hypothetical protein
MIDLEKTQFEDSTPPMTPPPLPATLGQVTRFRLMVMRLSILAFGLSTLC